MKISIIRKKAKAADTIYLYASFYLHREKVEIALDVSIDQKYFEKGQVKKGCPGYSDIHMVIARETGKINDILVKYRLSGKPLTKEIFRKEWENPNQDSDFFEFVKERQKIRFQEISEGTIKNHKARVGALKEFTKGKLLFGDMDHDLFRKFALFLKNKRKNKPISIRKTMTVISIYINEAIKKGKISYNPAKGISIAEETEDDIIALSEDELSICLEMYIERNVEGMLRTVLRFVLFLCFSSLHISDARRLRIEQIGKDEFTYQRKKLLNTHPKTIRVPISDPLRSLIEYYRKGRMEGVLIQDIPSDQTINKYLKEIARIAGINKKLSAKVGRHTFATIYLRENRDPNSLSKILGHSKISQTYVYIHVMDKDRKEGIKAFNKFRIEKSEE
ncbi:site-specific integrase [Porphyromonadaceae bacterium]